MTLPATALTDLETVRTEMDFPERKYDSQLERLIMVATARVSGHCGRLFHYEEDIEETVRGLGTYRLCLSRTPVLEVSSIQISDIVISEDDYQIEDAKAGFVYSDGGFPWTAQNVGNVAQDGLPGSEAPDLIVTYTGGYVCPGQVTTGEHGLARTLPVDLEDAVVQMVVSRWRNKGNDARVLSERVGDASITYTDKEIPDEIAALLAPYVRAVQA